ncbi:MAG TPA: hypothetical protein PLG63_09565 [bacterium]|nr:hypothetical protein [bacterium]
MKYLAVIILIFWSCTSCNGNNPRNDTENDIDMIQPDKDSDDLSDDLSDEADEESEALAESEDTESDETDDEVELADVDYQGAEECPELAKAKFPYYNDDLSIHFCRKCDKPTVKDPQCVENLWKDTAAALYSVSPESECEHGYPCYMPMIIPETLEEWIAYEEKIGHKFPYRPHECDMVLSPGSWATDSTAGAVKHFDISDGKVGLFLKNVALDYKKYQTYSKTMEYDPETQTYRALSPDLLETGSYNNGCMLHIVNNQHIYSEANTFRSYLTYSCSDGTRKVVYPRNIRYVSYTPALSEKWAIANIQEEDGMPDYTMYAKVGTWKWTKLMEGLSLFPQIVNDKVVFHDIDGMAYYCDLSKTPKSVNECVKINREGETIRFAVINENDETETAYESRLNSEVTITKITVSKEGKKTYSVIENTFSETDPYWVKYGYTPENYRDGFIFYTESYITNENGDWNGNHCFYNLAKKKRTCMKKLADHPFKTNPNLGFGEWEGKWIVYQFLQGSTQAVRDLDCYCEKEGVCPFEQP